MREIKFRAWHKEQKQMYYPNERTSLYFSSRLTAAVLGLPQADDTELMQYTGLKDKNGKEIYEGDIVICDEWEENIPVAVEWNGEAASFWVGNGEYFNDIDTSSVCVLSNIYENPELLK